mgnify:FL=1
MTAVGAERIAHGNLPDFHTVRSDIFRHIVPHDLDMQVAVDIVHVGRKRLLSRSVHMHAAHAPIQFVGIEVFARGREARQFHFECRERPVAGFERQRTFGVAQRQQRVVAVGKRKTQHPDRLSGGNLPHETAPGIEDEVTQRADIGRELFDAVGDVSDLHANIPAADIPVVLQRAGTQQQAEPRNGTCQHRRPAVYDMSCRPSHRFSACRASL